LAPAIYSCIVGIAMIARRILTDGLPKAGLDRFLAVERIGNWLRR
jgi:hypothetical protein